MAKFLDKYQTYTDAEAESIKSSSGSAKTTIIKRIRQKAQEKIKQSQEYLQKPEGTVRDNYYKEEYKKWNQEFLKHIRVKKKDVGEGNLSGSQFAKIVAMNIYHDGNLISGSDIVNSLLDGKLDVRNPKLEVFDEQFAKDYMASQTNIGKNLRAIKNAIERKAIKVEGVDLSNKFPLNKFLGAIDISKGENREAVYSYWEGIANKFGKVKEDMQVLYEELKKYIEENDVSLARDFETSRDRREKSSASLLQLLDSTFDMREIDRLQYIANFEKVKSKEVLSPMHNYFNIAGALIAAEHLFDKDGVSSGGAKAFANDSSEGESYGGFSTKEQQLQAEALTQLKDSDLGESGNRIQDSREIDLNEYSDDSKKWESDVKKIQMETDPLLMYSYFKGDKLISMSEEGYEELQEFLEELIDKIEETEDMEADESKRFKVTVDFKTNIEQWLENIEDTTSLDRESGFWLPISVMDDADFDDLYEGSINQDFEGVDGGVVDLDNLDEIEEFFEALYRFVSDDVISFATASRTSKRRQMGTDIQETFRQKASGRRQKITRRAAQRQFRGTEGEEGALSDELPESLKGALEKFMESSIEYYFDPSFTGMLPIQVPSFLSGTGVKIMQTLSLDLGLDSVMSGAYQKLMEGSEEDFNAEDLKNIANFLDNMFLKSIRIEPELIEMGERAANSMTDIFGQNTEQSNNDYFGAIIHHFMEETGKKEFEDDDFNGQSIKKRASNFEKGLKSRKAYPVFAMPFWLDKNQGLITGKDKQTKSQYERLKEIFEEVQSDLPVLIHKMLNAHDAIREQLGLPVYYGFFPNSQLGYEAMSNMMFKKENIDMTNYEVESVLKMVDSHENIGKEFGISSEQVYLIKSHFR